jgi:hypothetical protein
MASPGRPLGELKMETRKRWKMTRVSVFCADADQIKNQVDHALKLERRVKELIAQGILSGDSNPGIPGEESSITSVA